MLPDPVPDVWTPQALVAVGRLLGLTLGAGDPLLVTSGDGLPLAANAIALRWCRADEDGGPRCDPGERNRSDYVVRVEGCPLTADCSRSLSRPAS